MAFIEQAVDHVRLTWSAVFFVCTKTNGGMRRNGDFGRLYQMYELMLYSGIALVAVSSLAGAAFAVLMIVSKRRINAKLDEEYGSQK